MYTLTFTEQEMHWLNQAIGELPHKHAAPLIESINQQILKARAAAEAAHPVQDHADIQDSRQGRPKR
ncbi:MAG: hypothetical protein EOQ31_31600 [Mesorhizobium sp.]|uniref:hypothetical protein n=1 Tax=Mesorhizobium sp. TaxID=1871066 RepID=UPI000FE93840|nr:hypothetical protein [Mesorhizobium sp.]RWA81491.1 MAG: hypothetical protein EOQ31_31600 [Mesorhizobium sp.]